MAYLVRFSLAATVLFAFGCGGSQTDVEGPEEAEEPTTEDLVFDEFEALEIGGMVFEPEGIESAPDANVRGPQRRQAWGQARQAFGQGDYAAAAESLSNLVELFEEEIPPPVVTMAAYVFLRAHQNDEAAALTAEMDPADEELRGHQAYVAAWSAYRQGEFDRARDFIVVSAKKWPSREGQRAVVRDLSLMIARAATPVAQADELLSEIVGDSLENRYRLLFQLHEQYVFAGHYGLAAETLAYIDDVVLEGQELPHRDAVGFAYRRSGYLFRVNQPVEAAELALEAYQGLEPCGDECAGEAEVVMTHLRDLAQPFHTIYHTSLDPAFYDPAVALYEAYIGIPDRPDAETVRGYLSNLQQSHEHANPAQGKHDARMMTNVFVARREAIQACYEEALGWDPNLGGELVLTVTIDQSGSVTGVSGEPAASEEGLGVVTACASERVAEWSFPARSLPGTTTVAYPLVLSTETDATPDDAAGGPGEASAPAGDAPAGEG